MVSRSSVKNTQPRRLVAILKTGVNPDPTHLPSILDVSGQWNAPGPSPLPTPVFPVFSLSGLPDFPLDMYRFLIWPIREADQKDGALFVKRYLDGPNIVWQEIVKGLQNIPKLWSVSDIDDGHLQYLKNIVGWTDELKLITDRIDNASLRRLIAASGAIWRDRGPETTLSETLNLVTGGARRRIWNWFDFRWILDETGLGEEHDGLDPWVIDLPSESRAPQFSSAVVEENAEYWTNLRIVDDGSLDRGLVKDVVRLMKPANERYDITYVDFLDLFDTPGDRLQWDLSNVDFEVEDGLAKLTDDTVLEYTTAIVSTASGWSQYVYSAKIRGNIGTSGNFGLLWFVTDFDNLYAISIDTVSQTLSLQKRVNGSASVIQVVNLNTAGINVLSGVFYVIRVESVRESGTNRILVFIDGSELINTTDNEYVEGTVGFYHTVDATIEVSEVEVFELPVDSENLEINA